MQRVIYDPEENWLTIFHNGHEISLHEFNFLRLAVLVDEVRNRLPIVQYSGRCSRK